MEHRVNIEEEAVKIPAEVVFNKADGSENVSYSSSASSEIVVQLPTQFKKSVQLMNEMVDGVPPLPPEPCIFRVHERLRKGNEEAYTPALVSIGPYHHGNPKLRAMEKHKSRYLKSLLQRLKNDVEPYLLLMENRADEARGYYADPIDLEGDEFVRMMLLDACFIIEFLRKFHFKKLRDKDDPIFSSAWMIPQIFRDLILLENQLPFFLLSKLLDMTPSYKYDPLMLMAITPFDGMLPMNDSFIQKMGELDKKKDTGGSKHFLDLMHMFYRPSSGDTSDSRDHPIRKHVRKMVELVKKPAGECKHFLDLMNRFCLPSSGGTSDSRDHPRNCLQMSCVTELQEAGISFKVNHSDDVSIFDISFKHGHMKIPKLTMEDGTETFLRNIIAYEQHSSIKPKYFTDYHCFMDMLINTEKDAKALRLHGIIENLLGDDNEVVRIINKLGDNVTIGTTFYYEHVCEKVNYHYERSWNQAMAKLRRNYCNNPWASISTIAAVVLLLLTLIQTLAALNPLFDYYN